MAQAFKVEYTVRFYLMCLEDDLYETLENLNSTLKNSSQINPNEELVFNNLAIGQLYIIEVIPIMNSNKLSEKCSTKCPIFDDRNMDSSAIHLKKYVCEECKKMILIFHNTEDVIQSLSRTNESKCFEFNYKNDTNICSDFRNFENLKVLVLSNDNPLSSCKANTLHPRKYHVCSMEKKMIDYKEIPYKTILAVILPSFMIFVIVIMLLLLLNYSIKLYSKCNFFI